jgi:hypothetical protein
VAIDPALLLLGLAWLLLLELVAAAEARAS